MTAHSVPPFFIPTIRVLAVTALVTLTGCAKNYVVLLPDDNGAVGKLLVTSAAGTTILNQKNQGAHIGDTTRPTFVFSEAELKRDFGMALAASPKKFASYQLYFEAGQAVLSATSQAEISKIKNEMTQRPGADISVIGHTDTRGDAQANYELGLMRATLVSTLIADAATNSERVSIESHGEKNLLVITPDNTEESHNRRVEVIVR